MTPHWGSTVFFPSSQQLPRLRLGPMKGFLDTAPFKCPQLASCAASDTTENEGHSQKCHAMRGGLRNPKSSTDLDLDCEFDENLFWVLPKLEGLPPPPPLSVPGRSTPRGVTFPSMSRSPSVGRGRPHPRCTLGDPA